MTEIIRLTSQMQPLEVGVPLYPFSHASLFQKEAPPQDTTTAPLPMPQVYERSSPSPPNTIHGVGRISPNNIASPETILSGWAAPTSSSSSRANMGSHSGHMSMPTMNYASWLNPVVCLDRIELHKSFDTISVVCLLFVVCLFICWSILYFQYLCSRLSAS